MLARHIMSRGDYCVLLEKNQAIGGVWYSQANQTSKVNTSEAAYRIAARGAVINTDHTPPKMISEDVAFITSTYLS